MRRDGVGHKGETGREIKREMQRNRERRENKRLKTEIYKQKERCQETER